MRMRIVNVVEQLGITRNCKGFYYLVEALALILENPHNVIMVTKWIYPDVARRFQTTPACVERNLRTAARISWERNPAFLDKIARYDLDRVPTVGCLLSYLATYLENGDTDGYTVA